jgi:hypothetical protein
MLLLFWLAANNLDFSDTAETLEPVSEVIAETRLATPVPIRPNHMLAAALEEPVRGIDHCMRIFVAMHLTRDGVLIGHNFERREFRRLDGLYDWEGVVSTLDQYAEMPGLEARTDISVSADPKVSAGAIAEAIHVVRDRGFVDVGYTVRALQPVRFGFADLDDRFPLRAVNKHSVAITSRAGRYAIATDRGDREVARDLLELRRLLGAVRRSVDREAHSYFVIDADADESSEEIARIAIEAGYRHAGGDWRWVHEPEP